MWQKRPEGPICPIGLYSLGFKDAEKWYSTWEKELFLVNLEIQEAEKITSKQSIILQGLFKILKPILTGTPLHQRVAQQEMVRKWYVQLDHYCCSCNIEEGSPKILPIQEPSSKQLDSKSPPPLIKPAPLNPISRMCGSLMHPLRGRERCGNTRQ